MRHRPQFPVSDPHQSIVNQQQRDQQSASRTRPVMLIPVYPLIAALLLSAIAPRAAASDDGTYSHVLTSATFNQSLASAKEPWALVEFFASWCPACQYFKPEYEQVARLFNSPSSPNSDFLYVAKVDCATEGALCTRFSVSAYPSMFFGRPADISIGDRLSDAGRASMESVSPSERTAQGVMEWVNVRTDRLFALPKKQDAAAIAEEVAAAATATGTITATATDQQHAPPPRVPLVDIEEATAVAFDFIFTALPLTPPMRAPLEDFIRLLAQHHPANRCRSGASVLLRLLPLAWPVDAQGEEEAGGEGKHGSRRSLIGGGVGVRINKTALALAKICGPAMPGRQWYQCKSSIEGRRGYSCGLWLLFHSLSVRVPEGKGQWVVGAMRDFIAMFFGCGKCRDHFGQMAKDLHMDGVKTGKEAALWIWRAHNTVNHRLEREEAEASGRRGDPAHPKQQWPTKSMCAGCGKGEGATAVDTTSSSTSSDTIDSAWDLDQVHAFLTAFYGEPQGEEGGGEGGGGEAGGILSGGVERMSGSRAAAGGAGAGAAGGSATGGWMFGGLLLLVAACCVYATVRRSFLRAHNSRRRKLRSKQKWGSHQV